MGLLNTKIATSRDMERKSIDDLDIPIIDYDNALLLEIRNDDYNKVFHLNGIYNGLTKHNDQYYFFEHNIINTPKNRLFPNLRVYSYDIYPINSDLAKEIIENRNFSKWEVLFHSFFYYGYIYLSTSNGNYTNWYKFKSTLNDDTMTIPYGRSPSSITRSKPEKEYTIGDFLKSQAKEYKPLNKLEVNTNVFRDFLIGEIID